MFRSHAENQGGVCLGRTQKMKERRSRERESKRSHKLWREFGKFWNLERCKGVWILSILKNAGKCACLGKDSARSEKRSGAAITEIDDDSRFRRIHFWIFIPALLSWRVRYRSFPRFSSQIISQIIIMLIIVLFLMLFISNISKMSLRGSRQGLV